MNDPRDPYPEHDVELIDLIQGEMAAWWEDAETRNAACRIADQLHRAGRLLPPGSEVREEWGVRLTWDDGMTDDGHMQDFEAPPATRAKARVAFHRRKIEEVPDWRVRKADLISRRVITTLWSPVPEGEPS